MISLLRVHEPQLIFACVTLNNQFRSQTHRSKLDDKKIDFHII